MRRDLGGNAWLTRPLEIAVHNAPRAEANLLRQADKILLRAPSGSGSLLAAERGQALIALGDPLFTTNTPALIEDFKHTAETQNRLPFLYKISGRSAVAARKMGFTVTPVSNEAWLRPVAFDLTTSTHRQLRRKLRKAEKAGITIKPLHRHADMHLAMGEMTRVAQEWAAAHGGERGFTMGIFEPAYVQTQQCFLAYQDQKLVAFATFSTVAREWTLDLMRHGADLPDGTMHSLIVEAIAAANHADVPRLSLASVPWRPALCAPRLIQGFRGYFARASGGSGLAQFKNSFAPQWEVLYMAAPTRFTLLLGAFDVLRSVVSQPSLTDVPPSNGRAHAPTKVTHSPSAVTSSEGHPPPRNAAG
jgi:phosphatidylglycerol lysyltransferase